MKKILLVKKLLLTASILPFISSCSLIGQGDNSDYTSTNSASSNCTSASVYKANGKNYRALKSSEGYKSEGLAVVYSNKAQGSETTGCESFDMNGFTAAHRTLPLPTHVKITNKSNGKAVVVKVNDRGPATGNHLIQVTPAVANLLGASANFPARIEAINTSNILVPSAASVTPLSNNGARSNNSNLNNSARVLRPVSRPKPVNRSNADRYYIVVGTYQTKKEAFDRFIRVSSIGLANVAMETRQQKGRSLHMVRIGPFYNQDTIDNAKDRLRNDGLVTFNVVKN